MKRSKVLKTVPERPERTGNVITAQAAGDILILNYWEDKELLGRYCMNTFTHEYEAYYPDTETWRQRKLQTMCGYDAYWYCNLDAYIPIDSEKDAELIRKMLPARFDAEGLLNRIGHWEGEYNTNQREAKEERRLNRINNLMSKVPPLPEGFKEWIFKAVAEGQDYAFCDKSTGWSCTACGRRGKIFKRPDGKKATHNDRITCPFCGKAIQAKTRTNAVKLVTNALILQDMDQDMGVARHFDVQILWSGQKREIKLSESVRVLLLRNHQKYACDIFYNQCPKGYGWSKNKSERFDHPNPAGRRMQAGYLYPEGIARALQGTCYKSWDRLFKQLAEAGKKLDYNRLMTVREDQNFMNLIEYLFKGRFNQLLEETAEKISLWSCEYYGPLQIEGASIEEVFGLTDRQKINRIRDCNGGGTILKWLQWSETTGKKINQETLEWLASEKVETKALNFISPRMTPQQVMNYVKRQQLEGYEGKSTRAVLEQWADYLNMSAQLGKDTADEMVYRPRELKRRHNEAVEEMRKQRIIEQLKRDKKANEEAARKMGEKYPGAEEVLKEIRPKYEYGNDEYTIKVPERLMDIVTEGNALHHCAGSTERYFERIMQRETYICFLRRKSEPDIPYYTIEVEPSGTIRQHRSYLDEEPGIEEIRGFLKEWQKVIKKRLTEEDHRLAKESAIKRQKNIEELIEKNNARVLKGLEEDFMEAV